jgi:hypothetical protein
MKEIAARRLTSRFHISVLQDEEGNLKIEVIKTTNGQPIPEEEPLVLFRGRDQLAAPALLCYQALIKVATYPDPLAKEEHILSNKLSIAMFEEFSRNYPDRMKLPNITRGK